jgi:putative long chain acyl-CoA synthase
VAGIGLGSRLQHLGAAAQNALEVARFGGLETGEESSPFEVVAERPVYRLRRYHPEVAAGPPIVLVPPLMLSSEVYDVSPSASAVTILSEHGTDPWVVDFGSPEHEKGGLERSLTDHVLAVSDAVERVGKAAGRPVHLAGYSQGGMFCYQAAAYRRSDGIASLVTFGSPVDTTAALPLGIPEGIASRGAGLLAGAFERRAVPAWVSREGFRLLDPVKSLRQRLDFVRSLGDREALLPRERQRRFLMGEGWVAWPGPALAEFMRQFIVHNRMLSGGFVIEGRMVTLADITSPLMYFVGEIDEIAPAKVVRAVRRAVPEAEIYEVALRAGHFGLVVGSSATRTTWPVVADWAHWRDGEGERPEVAVAVDEFVEEPASRPSSRDRATHALGLTANVGIGIARSTLGTAREAAGAVRDLTGEAAGQLSRLSRLERVRPGTRISIGMLLDEQAGHSPEDVLFLWEDRAYTQAQVKHRIDSVVRGLLSVGIRQGEHVGVLMSARPSALAVVGALNRLGAVAVLMRPDGPVLREAELGQVNRIIADPELSAEALEAGVPVLVLGGGAEPRELGANVTDMERIDPEVVELPAWYEPNPGRASDLAFILFTGEGERTRSNRISNGRWVLSAFGTASSAALTPSDTVYSVTPVYHPSGLLMSIGGAIAGGARLALARAFDPETFWDEVRRYGVTVSAYTWTMLRDLVEAPADARERHHPVRLFIGSGMPRGLWRRVIDRFAPAGVLEFYASTEGDAILVNVSGSKPGSKGRPLPGSADVRIAAYDPERGQLEEGPDGFAIPSPRGERGMLLARVRSTALITSSETPLRGLFEPGDAWLSTGDLFMRDVDGDYWLVAHAHAMIRTDAGLVASNPIEDALGDVAAVDLVTAYGVKGAGHDIAVAAVTVRSGHELGAEALTEALSILDLAERPSVVRAVDAIPLTTWYRPLTGPLRAEGIPEAGAVEAWSLDLESGEYKPLDAATRTLLLGEDGAGVEEPSGRAASLPGR